MPKDYDFSGWATRNDIRCSDGRTIKENAFIGNDGKKVPMVWNHQHNSVNDVIGHCMLENRSKGVYAYGYFNDTPSGVNAKNMVMNGDVDQLSIYANNLQQRGGDVLHGTIREVSLVLAGANPGAYIDNVIMHSDDDDRDDGEALIYTGFGIVLSHSEEDDNHSEDNSEEDNNTLAHKEDTKVADNKEETVGDVLDTLNDKQREVVTALIAKALAEGAPEEDEEGEKKDMKHNAFSATNEEYEGEVLSHSEMVEIIGDGKRYGSMKESFLAHGITNIEYLFPDAKNITNEPIAITRKMDWVTKVMNKVHRTPFSKIKSLFADLTEDEARAKGYIKGNLKVEQVFSLLKRTTSPTTVYKKQKLDRDDVIDITDIDVIAFIKTEMRFMLEEEIARAILVGDGRLSSSDDHINTDCIRPIWTDAALYTIPVQLTKAESATPELLAKNFIKRVIKARKDYKGSGNPDLWVNEDTLTDILLLEDGIGRRLYPTVNELATTLRVGEIIPVPVMEGLTRTVSGKDYALDGIIVNLNDYNVGADKGGQVNMFDDFDIDYNAQKYLIETRCSGAMIRPYAAMIVEHDVTTESPDPEDQEDGQ